jgi:hypothetical protein
MDEPRYDSGCSHHWAIDSAEGPTSLGRCKLCGAERSFLNQYKDLRGNAQKRMAELQRLDGH